MSAWIARLALLFACCAPCLSHAAGPAACGPDSAGSPCGETQVAGMAGTGGVPQGAGNPVNLITGNKHQRETDMAALPGMLGLELVRHYNSHLAGPGMPLYGIGRGWQLSYDTRLFVQGRTLQIVQADGARLIFARSAWSATLCSSRDPAQGVVLAAREADAGTVRYRWLWPEGRELGFDRNGRLLRIAMPSGEALEITRLDDGRIARVTDPQGRSLSFNYLKRSEDGPGRLSAIQSVDAPVGRFVYGYGDTAPDAPAQHSQNLVTVHLPTRLEPGQLRSLNGRGDRPADYSSSTLQRRYHYDDPRFPTLLTGISLQGSGGEARAMDRRIATWAYDANGLAVLSVSGEPARIGPDGQPVAGTGTGQITLDRREPGRTRVTGSDGGVTVYRHAIVGGAFRLLEARGAGCGSCGPVDVRYGYDELGRLREVTRLDRAGTPVEGRREERDALGRTYASKTVQYAKGRETGRTLVLRQLYPAIGMAHIRPGAGLVPSHYGPKLVAMQSVLPGRDRTTAIEYNDRRQPVTVTETGSNPVDGSQSVRITRYRYEAVRGRSLLAEVDGPLPNGPGGTPADSDITRYEWDGQGAFMRRISHPMGAVSELERDPHSGRLAAMTVRWGETVRQVRYAYDPSGQVASVRERALGKDGVTVLDEREVSVRRDGLGQPSAVVGIDGALQEIGRTVPGGMPSAAPFPGGAGLMPSQYGDPLTAAAREALRFDANGVAAERRFDDFGQVAAIRNPGQGWQHARYDAAGRIVEIRDARGALTRAEYDAAGRLLQVDRTLAGGAPERLDFRWRGPHRESETVAIDGRQAHATHYRHTPWGQVSRLQVEIAAEAGGAPVRMQVRTRYDRAGRIGARTLPGGERLAWRYYAGPPYRGQRAAIERMHWPAWLDGVMARLPEAWLDKWRLKTRVASFAPQESGDAAQTAAPATSALSADAPQAEPGMGAGSPGAAHDAAGLPHRIATARGELLLRWNAAAQLTGVDAAAGKAQSIARYRYDARGRRASKHTAAGSEYYLYEGTQLLAVVARDTNGRQTQGQFLYEGYRAVTWLRDGVAYSLVTDSRGALSEVQSPADAGKPAQTLWRADLDAWGKRAGPGEPHAPDPRLRLLNQYADDETGLSYHIARYYDPTQGRFISPDPAGIADSIDAQVPAALKLDLTAYAAGQPYWYVDPDGAARLVYYAITTNAKGNALGVTQGFTRARWAFSVDGIEASGDGGSDEINKLMKKYAASQKGLLFDGGGNYLKEGKKVMSWEGAADETVDGFKRHYGNNLVSVPQFTITDYSNKDAALLIASMIGGSEEAKLCTNNNLLLPEVRFAPGDLSIIPTDINIPQRMLNCGDADLENSTAEPLRLRKFIKLNQALALNEVSVIYKDCRTNGCPSIAGILINGAQNNEDRIPAAYSHLQFAPETLTEIIVDNLFLPEAIARNQITQTTIESIFNGDASRQEIIDASSRARWAYVYGSCMSGGQNNYSRIGMGCPANSLLSTNWSDLSLSQKNEFTARTGLSAEVWGFLRKRASGTLVSGTDYVRGTNEKEILDATAWAAWNTSETSAAWFKNLAKDNGPGGRMEKLAIAYLQIRENELINHRNRGLGYSDQKLYPLANQKSEKDQRDIDLEMAMRISRRHNGGAWWGTLPKLKSNDPNDYVKKIAGEFQPTGFGNFPSLRCFSKSQSEKSGFVLQPLNLR